MVQSPNSKPRRRGEARSNGDRRAFRLRMLLFRLGGNGIRNFIPPTPIPTQHVVVPTKHVVVRPRNQKHRAPPVLLIARAGTHHSSRTVRQTLSRLCQVQVYWPLVLWRMMKLSTCEINGQRLPWWGWCVYFLNNLCCLTLNHVFLSSKRLMFSLLFAIFCSTDSRPTPQSAVCVTWNVWTREFALFQQTFSMYLLKKTNWKKTTPGGRPCSVNNSHVVGMRNSESVALW